MLDTSRQRRLPCRARQNELSLKRKFEKTLVEAIASGVKLIFENLVDEF